MLLRSNNFFAFRVFVYVYTFILCILVPVRLIPYASV